MRDEGGERLLRQPAHRPGEPDRRHHLARVVAQRRRDAAHAELALLVLDGAAARAHAFEHLPQRLRIGDGLRRARGKPVAHHALDHVGRLERQDRLALGGAIGGLAHADVGAHADRLRALQIEHVHDLAAVEHGEMHRLVHLLAQVAQQRPRLVRHGHAPAHQRAQPEQRDAEPVFAGVGVLLQHAVGDERHREAMHRALGDAEALGQIADADLDLLLGKRLEQPHRRRDRGQAALVGGARWRAGRRHVIVPLRGPAFRKTVEHADVGCRGQAGWAMARNIVVIGGGPAAVFAAIEAKKKDGAANVTLVTDEACEPYEKPPLSKAVLLGKAKPEDAPIAGPGGLAKHGVAVKLNTRCTAIDRAARPGRHHRRRPALRRAGDRHRLADARTAAAADGHAARALPAHRGARPRHQGRPRRAASIWW